MEVKTCGEAEASGTGEAAYARIRADRANAAIIESVQGPGSGGGNERLGEGGGRGWFQNFYLQLLLVPPGPRTPSP